MFFKVILSLRVIGPIPIMLTELPVGKVTKVFRRGLMVVNKDLL